MNTPETNNITSPHAEIHRSQRANWLRAAVLGANDGIVSTASLMVGVATATSNDTTILTAGIAGLVAGALSMAAGEYVSVSSQRDSEREDIAIEQRSIANDPEAEMRELAQMYQNRGVEKTLALKVAKQMHDHDAVAAHAREELGIDTEALVSPWQAAIASAAAFSFGAALPIIAAVLATSAMASWAIVITSLVTLTLLGLLGAIVGGGSRIRAALRVLIGGSVAMAITALIGHFVGMAL